MKRRKMVKTITSPERAIESRSSFLWLDDDGILVFINKPVPVHDLKGALENLEFSKKISLGKPRPLLVDMTATKSMTREAREEYAKAGVDSIVTAIGLVTRSAMSRIVANFFLSFNQPAVPTRL
ncbi:MAG TPA: hypothetical protein VIN07_08065, partial [Flavipsychrobacter sp.]